MSRSDPPLAPPSPPGRGAGGEGYGARSFSRHVGSVARARRLRTEMTVAERRIWARLRRDALGLRCRRQHPIGPFVVDFYVPACRLAIELDGGQHDLARDQDRRRSVLLGRHGVSVLRFWNSEVLSNLDGTLAAIAAVIERLSTQASPSIPLRGGGGGANGEIALDSLRLTLAERSARC